MKNVEDIYPLSPLQNGMLFHSLMAPESGVYVNQAICTLSANLDSCLFRQAWEKLIKRHGVLRTAFLWEGLDEPLQVVRKNLSLPWQELDWRGLPADEQQRRFEELCHQDRHTPLTLSKVPLMRFSLIRLDREIGFIWTFHHLLLDGWSVPLLVQELGAVYTALQEGREPALPPVRPFSEYIVWLQKQDLSRAEQFWLRELAGFTAPNSLGIDHPAGGAGTSGYAEHRIGVSREVTAGLQALATQHKLTLQTVTFGAWALLISRYSSEEDVVFGSVVSGRPAALPGVETMIGLFINTLPVRVRVNDAESLAPWLQRVQEHQLTLNEFEYSPLVQVQRWSEIPPGSALFKTLYVFENYPGGNDGPNSLSIGNLRGFEATNYPLTLALIGGDQIPLRLTYDRARIEDSAVPRLLLHLVTLLSGMAAGPERCLGELDLLTAEERLQLSGWNDTPVAYSLDRPLHSWIEEQVNRTPMAVAVDFEGEELSYSELDHRASRLTLQLRARGCGPESRVGVLLERSCELLVALLGILKVGAAYVPLDLDQPASRLAFQKNNANLRLVLTRRELAGRLSGDLSGEGDHFLFLEHGDSLAGDPIGKARPAIPVNADCPAYVLYTSGSTGQPKGVIISHRAIVNRLLWMQDAFRLDAGDRVLQKTPFTFDVSVWELFWPLMTGACLVVARPGGHRDNSYLVRLVAGQEITVLHFVPSMLQLFLEEPGVEECRTLRDVVCSGEALPTELARRFAVRLGHVRLHNLYGPTEAAVDVTSWLYEGGTDGGSVPIGRPIANTRIHLLDPHLLLVPVGIPGELFIGGVNLARGYVDRPDLTAERFLPASLGGGPGERVYRTGDLACYRWDGAIEFLGRIDHQVKLRGFRIELGEIEAVLLALSGVREAVVVAREDKPGERRLVAYVVGDVAAGELRQSLRERLPDYMVPAAFVTLAALPLTSNGKVNRKALPAPEGRSAAESYLAPQTPVEEILAEIWSEVLGMERVGASDHFFDLGGHSLLATQVISRLRGAFAVEVPLRDLFEAPTLRALAARVEAALRVGASPLTPPLVPVPREGPLPLSFAQQRLWFIDQLEPGRPLYNVPVVLSVEGPLNSALLGLCLGEIVRRHEALRTVFTAVEGLPVQSIQPAAPFVLSQVDLSGRPEREREALALRLAGEEAVRPFDLTCGPLFRGVLLRLAEDCHVFALTMHHIVSDGWSLGILVQEITSLYAAIAAGRSSPLPELPVQYADFAVWQHSWLHGAVLENEISFWRRQLAGLPPRLDLPTDRPRPGIQSFRGASRPVQLGRDLSRESQALGRQEGATLFMVLLAGFQALLARYSGQQDLAVGTSVAGRNRTEIEGLIGFFVNTLVLRSDLSGAPSFRDLLGGVRRTALAAHTYQDVPFEKLVQELTPERSLAHAPLFQVMLILQNAPVTSLEIQDLRLRPAGRAGTTAKFDLTLSLTEWSGGLSGTLEYARDLFDGTTIDRLSGHFERLLATAVANPDLSVWSLPFLSLAERAQTLVEWNDTGSVKPGACLHELFEAQVQRTPEAVALIAGARELLYRELNQAADRLAIALRQFGVGPEVIVGVFLERSVEMVAALLAVLKAGAAYLPLDPQHPQPRLAVMLTSARVAVMLSEKRLVSVLPWSGPVLLVDGDAGAVTVSRSGPSDRADPENLAYVLYTSGSTGVPKGIAVTHRSAVALVLWAGGIYGREELSGVLAATSLGFDLSIFELFVPLCWGGTVILAQNVLELPTLASTGRVTLVNTVPSAMSELVQAGSLGSSIRTVNLAGEPLPRSLVERIYAGGGVERVWNLYGPSEATTYSTFSRVARASSAAPGIGRAIRATQAYVLAIDLEPVPVGVVGELCLGGAGLARGYLQRPALTAERFIPDLFSSDAGARLYRTGDLVRWMSGGDLEILGRIDHQVKIRGFRIELGEVEAVLVSLAGVRKAVVVSREDRPGDRSLVAYVVGDVSADVLRQGLRERLPDYMVPATFMALAALPLTANGKVDRKALPAPERQSVEESFLGPRTPVEEVLAGIWAELLGVERVGPTAHFFDLGGHSLLATRVMARVHSAFHVEMPLRDLFEAPTLGALAARIEASLRSGAVHLAPPLVPLAPPGREGPLPLSFAQQRLWFIDQLEAGRVAYNVPMALAIEGPLDCAVLGLCLGEIVRRHEVLRTVFAAPEGTPVQVIQPSARFILPLVDLSCLGEREREALVLKLAGEEAVRPFDLYCDLLLRGVLLRLAESAHVAMLTLHHIASDGWSMGILIREVTALYAAFAAGSPSPLPELPVQYADFAVWQRSWLAGEILEREIRFWRQQLADLPPRLELPTDRSRPAVQSFRGASQRLQLSSQLTRQLQVLGRRESATLFMVLLAGFQSLLARYSGQQDFAIGTPVAGRNRVEIEGLIGFFVNTLVLRSDVSGDPSFRALLGRVRETALAAHTHQDVPFERLVEELSPERSLAQSPLFQVVLVLQNAPSESLEIQNLRLQPISRTGITAKFDLTLNFAEWDGGLSGTMEYATDLFDAATVGRLTLHYERLLAAALAAPESVASELPLLHPAERQQLLREWNDTRTFFPREATIHALFAREAELRPSAVAVEQREERLTYAELQQRAKRLARRLVARGLRPEERVVVLAERSPDLITALLGILLAGGAYLPLDPSYPAERLAWMIRDAGASLLVTPRSRPATGIGLPEWLRLVTLNGEEPEAADLPEVPAAALAYVMYTSGSTGTPKGVAVTHRNVVRLVREADYADLGPDQTWLQYAMVSFDASTLEIWAPLLNGGRLVLFPGLIGSLDDLARVVESHGVTSAWLTAGLFHEIVDGQLEGLRPLNQLLAGGDVVSPAHSRRVLEAHPGLTLINGYGPTEGTTFTCCHRLTAPQQVGESVPIGRPIANGWAYVLDERLDPVPMGAWGELYAGGEGLARGYLERPELTAERFVPDALKAEMGQPGGRLYRTGDRVRWRADGTLEFLGRIDNQVKLRGFRIEPGEIEATLVQHPGVREALVTATREPGGGLRLTAYVIPALTAPTPEELRTFLRQRLPAYMMPGSFVALERWPLTLQGKVDRRALPRPVVSGGRGRTAPASQVEEIVAGIWSEVLALEGVGTADDFFELGGHSLLATQVISRLQKVFGLELSLRQLFETPTVAGLAAAITKRGPSATAPWATPVRPIMRGMGEDPPLSFAQERLWFLDRLYPGTSTYNIATALRLTGTLDGAAFRAAFAALLHRHEPLRTNFVLAGGEPVQRIAPHGNLELLQVDLRVLPCPLQEEEARRLITREAARPFDLATDPLVRVQLIRLADDEHAVLVALHHIVADGWSMAIFVRELAALYTAARAGSPSPLPELPICYADFAIWQRGWLTGEVLAAELAHWRERLGGAPALLELPTDRPRPLLQRFAGGRRKVVVPRELGQRLAGFGRHEGATLFMMLLAAFDILLYRYTRQRDLVVGSPIAGRDREETEGLIGLFLNTLALRLVVDGNPGFRALVHQAREVSFTAYAHQHLPFEKLVTELGLERSLAHAPLFQVLLVLQNTPARQAEFPELAAHSLDLPPGTAKFDLVLNLGETEAGIEGWLLYRSDLFDSPTAERLVQHFGALLAAVAEDPERGIGELPLHSPAERQQLLQEWSGAPGRGEPLYARLAAQVSASWREPAVVGCGEVLTYGDLHARVRPIAGRLRQLGVGPGKRVGLCLERSPSLVAGLLATVATGGAYVILEPSYPAERLSFLVGDSGIAAILSRSDLAGRLPAGGPPVLLLDRQEETAAEENVELTEVLDDLLYIIYTSGSTGQPKGAGVYRRGFSNLLSWFVEEFGITAEDRFLVISSAAFDLTQKNFFAPLLVGGLLVVADPVSYDPRQIAATVERYRITRLNCTPSAFYPLIEGGNSGRLSSLRSVFLGGEPISAARLAPWRLSVEGRTEVVNTYGPTECTDVVAFHRLAPGDSTLVPAGRPLPGFRLLVVDPHLEPLPIGVPGQLTVGGVGVGAGYLGRPELTAEKFVPDPFTGEPGARLYWTGDLARALPNGEIDFLGRADHQVKVRGFRIELGEIEAALEAHPAVLESVVIARQEASETRLVAYVVAREERPRLVPELREALLSRLPEYMIPGIFATLPALPRNANGKVDRRALPDPEAALVHAGGRTAPRTKLERFLASLFCQSLGVEEIGVEESFFDVGGDSISGAILVNRVQESLGEILHVVAIFDNPTIADLAAYLTRDYPEAVARLCGGEGERSRGPVPLRIDAFQMARLREVIAPLTPLTGPPAAKNPPALFILSAPRSGSTLLRVMLAGHPHLFAPPELELLSFHTMAERKAAFSGRNRFWLEGLQRAIKEIRGCSTGEAQEIVAAAETSGWTTQRFYREMQVGLGERLLVDKSPSYALDGAVLARAEACFAGARYIHLMRHPIGMIHSFVEAKLDQVFFRHPHPFSRRELAELIWLLCQQNILDFLAGVPAERQHRVRFEDLVRTPETVLTGVCHFLGVDFHPDMAQPYKDTESRMTDGLYAESRMLGDVKFLTHRRVDAGVAERSRRPLTEPLGELTVELATALGYASPATDGNLREVLPSSRSAFSALVPLHGRGSAPPLFLVHPVGGRVHWYSNLARRLGADRTVYGLQSTAGRSPGETLEEMAARYLDEVRLAQPEGPYLLGGWSMGGAVAFEMARQLAKAGEPEGLLVLIDPPPPRAVPTTASLDEGALFADLLEDLEALSGRRFRPDLAEILALPAGERLSKVLAVAQAAGVLPAELQRDHAAELLALHRHNRSALLGYVPGSYAGPLLLLRAEGSLPPDTEDPTFGWRDLAIGGTEVAILPGDHYSILRPPALEALAAVFASALAPHSLLSSTIGSTREARRAGM